MRSLCLAAIAVLVSTSPADAQRARGNPLSGIDAWMRQAMAAHEVPGVAMAVVKDDSVVLMRGWGVRQLGGSEPVDAETMFAIASVTKAFTGVLVGMMVDEGKVRWDDPATQHIPNFQLFDPYVTRELTVRDLLTHRSGLSRGDMVWYASDVPTDEILRRVRYLRPSWSLRSQYGYQNIMYIAAGEVAARSAQTTWPEMVRQRILEPLGMRSSNTTVSALVGQPNVASPHERIDDTVRAIPYRNVDNVGAAGAINSNVRDMVQWVRFQLDSARVGGRRLLTSATFAETHTPQTVIRRDQNARETYPFTNFATYGLGWTVQDYRGERVVQHGGNLDGMSAMVALMPDRRIGVVILTNMDITPLRDVIWRHVFDQYLGAPPFDWSGHVLDRVLKQRQQARETQERRDAQRVANTRPTLALDRYAGTYHDSLYGEVRVAVEEDGLVLSYGPGFVGELEHWHYDTFRANWRDRGLGRAMVTFAIGTDASVSSVNVEGIATFDRADRVDTVPRVRLTAEEQARLTGSFRAATPPLAATVEVVGGTLRMVIAGQPPYTLVAESHTRFRLAREGMPPGFIADFDLQGGRAARFTLTQPAPRPTMTFEREP